MSALTHEPALRFWLRYVEREGALVEDAGDHAVALLPEPIRIAAQLDEAVAVTSDPDVAREDGAILLIPGHPALERAASAVLDEGDAGRVHLPWPGSVLPGKEELQAKARERFDVDHGRIDAAGAPKRVYAPLLRVGAMVSYTASLTLRFQEQEEAWVDARTGLALSADVRAAVCGRAWPARPDTTHAPLEADLKLALPLAHAELERSAAERGATLLAQAQRSLAAELARADAYYEDALRSIARRRGKAAPDRIRLLDGQAEATHAERARRRREIEEQFRPEHEIRPFRLHLVHVPALVLPVEIRRGSRSFRFALHWLVSARTFADVRCPRCGAAETLVAGKEALGCRSCLARRVEPISAPAGAPPAAAPPAAAPPAAAPPAAAPPAAMPPVRPPARPKPRVVRPAARKPPPASRDRRPGSSVVRTGNKLALAFWQAVGEGTRRSRRTIAPHSPLSALHRLYGTHGPLYALGVPPGEWPSEFTALTLDSVPGAPELTTGAVLTAHGRYPYALTWWLAAGKPVIGEVAAGSSLGADRFEAPAPRGELDSVARSLWAGELSSSGMLMAVRCLATWWRIEAAADPSHPAPALAAAVVGAVARASATGRRRGEIAAAYGADQGDVARVERALAQPLRLDRERGW